MIYFQSDFFFPSLYCELMNVLFEDFVNLLDMLFSMVLEICGFTFVIQTSIILFCFFVLFPGVAFSLYFDLCFGHPLVLQGHLFILILTVALIHELECHFLLNLCIILAYDFGRLPKRQRKSE